MTRWIRDLYVFDNLPVLRGLETDSVDLIYLDPPFNSKKQYAAPIGTEAEGQNFDDTWRWDALNISWLGEIDRRNAALSAVIQAGRATQGNGTAAYLTMMGIRLLELQRVLKPTGSIYLHCDDTANAYLRASMDAVFGEGKFRNNLTWRRFNSHSDAGRFGRVTDTLLFYANGEKPTWNPLAITTPKTPDEIEAEYKRKDDPRGRYRSENLTGRGVSKGASGAPWRGFNPSDHGRCWSVPLTGRYAEWIERTLIPGYREIISIHGRLDALHDADMILLPHAKRKWPGLKRFAAADVGVMPQNLILEPMGFTNYTKHGRMKGDEWTGWATQKPIGLLQPLIKVASNPGDLVLDPFCGCATTCVAAEVEGRQWIGIDACTAAEDITRVRLSDVAMMDWNDDLLNVIREAPPAVPPPEKEGMAASTRTYRSQENIDQLYGKQHGDCPGCGNHYKAKDMHIDHIHPQDAGGGHEIENLQLLCGHCNSTKQTGTMESLWDRLVEKNVLAPDFASMLRKRWHSNR